MKISKVRISNILGIKELEFKAGEFNEISGRNGEGKTSIIEAFKSVFQSGNDVTLIRKGTAKGEVGLEIDDGTQIIKTFSDKAELKVLDASGARVKSPASYLDKLVDLVSINPVAFLTAEKKNRTNILLESLPLKLSKEDLRGIDVEFYSHINLGFMHALESISLIHKGIFDERTGINRVIKDKDATVKELQCALNDVHFDPSQDYSLKVSELEKLKDMMENKIKSIVDDFEKGRHEDIEKEQGYYLTAKDKIEQEYQDGLAKLQAKREQQLLETINNFDLRKEAINESFDKHIQSRREAFNEKYNPLIEQLGTLRERQKQFSGYQKQNELLEKFVEERESAKVKSESLSNQLMTLDGIKTSLISGLPIDGLEVVDGQIYRHGVIFDRLNTAQQIDIAVEIAKLRAGDIGVICVDGLERFDKDTFEVFKQKAEESNLQLFVTRVSDSELSLNGSLLNNNGAY